MKEVQNATKGIHINGISSQKGIKENIRTAAQRILRMMILTMISI